MDSVSSILAAYRDNADYEEVGSVAKAKAFATAVRRLLGLPKRARKGGPGGVEQEFDTEMLRAELADARSYIAANDTTAAPQVLDVNFAEFDTRT